MRTNGQQKQTHQPINKHLTRPPTNPQSKKHQQTERLESFL